MATEYLGDGTNDGTGAGDGDEDDEARGVATSGEVGSGPGDGSEVSEPPSVARLLALTDGVVAIALTLLVLSLKIPDQLAHPTSAGELAHSLGQHVDVFIAYLVSFYVIGIFWLVHHRTFRAVRGHSEGLAWWNFAFLLFITLMPFTSDLIGIYGSNPLAIDIFALNLLLASLSTQLVLIFAERRHLLNPGSEDAPAIGRARLLGTSLVLVASMAVAWYSTAAARYVWVLLIFLPTYLQRRAERTLSARRAAGGPPTG